MALLLRIVMLLTWLGHVTSDYQCICNYLKSIPVYADAALQSQQIGTLGEFVCKSEIPTQSQISFGIAFKKRVGYVDSSSGMVLQQTCPGSPPIDDIVTKAPAVITPQTTVQSVFNNGDVSRCPQFVQSWTGNMHSNHFLGQSGNSCYAMDPSVRMKVSDAVGLCQSFGAHIVDIADIHEQDFVQAFLQNNGFYQKTWIGYTDYENESVFKWTSGSRSGYNNWKPSEPSAFAHNFKDCTVLDVGDHGLWETKICEETNSFICEYALDSHATKPPANLGSIIFGFLQNLGQHSTAPTTVAKASKFPATNTLLPSVSSNVFTNGDTSRCSRELQTWEQSSPTTSFLAQRGNSCYTLDTLTRRQVLVAEATCILFGAHLVDIRNDQEQDFIQEFLQNKGFHQNVWIGYTDYENENTFKWTSGCWSTYNNWKPSEPSALSHEGKDCTVLAVGNHGLWETRSCEEKHTFICEYATSY